MSLINKKNTFKFPFDINPNIFLGLAILFFILSIKQISNIFLPKITPQILATKIEKDIAYQIHLFEKNIEKNTLIKKASNQNINFQDVQKLIDLPIQFQLFSNHQIVFWNTYQLDALSDTIKQNTPILYQNKIGSYVLYAQSLDTNKKSTAILCIPIQTKHSASITNLINYYSVAQNEGNLGIDITEDITNKTNYIPVHFEKNKIFNLYQSDSYLNYSDNNLNHLIIKFLLFIFFGISIHTYFKVQVKKKNPILIFLTLISLVFAIRMTTYLFGFPNDFTEFSLYSPEGFANDIINKSLGDLFINMCLLFWILLFFIINIQKITSSIHLLKLKIFILIIILLFFVLGEFILFKLGSNLIIESNINFDFSRISQIDLSSFIGLITILVLCANMFLITILTNNYLNNFFSKNIDKYLCILFTLLFSYISFQNEFAINYSILIICQFAYFIILDLSLSKIKFDFNSGLLLIWVLAVTLFSSIFISILIEKKELKNQKKIAENIIYQKDISLEYNLDNLLKKLIKDETIADDLSNINEQKIDDIFTRMHTSYLSSYTDKYKVNLYIFDKNKININPFDSTTFTGIDKEIFNKNTIKSTFNDNIILSSEAHDFKYITHTDIYKNDSLAGTLFIVFENNLSINRSSDFEYNKPFTSQSNYMDNNYSLALYIGNQLAKREGIYRFDYNIRKDILFKSNNTISIPKNDYEEFFYNFPQENKTVLIVKKNRFIKTISTYFAYCFIIYFSVILLYILGNIIARSNLNIKRFYNLLSLNLRLRIQISILLIVFLALTTLGIIISKYLKTRIIENYHNIINNYTEDIFQKIKNTPGFLNYLLNNDTTNISLAQVPFQIQKNLKFIHSNVSFFSYYNGNFIYKINPHLQTTNYTNNLLPFYVFFKLTHLNVDREINFNNDLKDHFITSYSLIRNPQNDKIAIMQLPNIYSTQELSNETNYILINIINIAIFVLLIASLFAFLISNSIVKPFQQIIKQFTKINLSEINKPLKWDNNDEIGLLVKQYNRMLRKLEINTKLLKKNEREMAWREMAKQVAHEIKNPLTPMKLSMQMLERAIKENSPNVTELTKKVTHTIIEQIDNLTSIATNFSNFAKLPESNNEIIELNKILYIATGIYNDNQQIEFLFHIPNYQIKLNADKNQLTRLFINIIENAVQAIPSNQKGYISLTISKIKNNFVRISIEDNGIGISEEQSRRLFEPKFTTKSSGTGIGLAMCKDIIEQIGGKITFESQVNIGTIFHIDLPIYSN